jgi:hypothetical protein
MNINLHRLPFRLPFLPRISVVSDHFLLLAIDRDDRPTPSQERLTLALDLAKLRIPIRMLFPLFGLGIASQTVMEVM